MGILETLDPFPSSYLNNKITKAGRSTTHFKPIGHNNCGASTQPFCLFIFTLKIYAAISSLMCISSLDSPKYP